MQISAAPTAWQVATALYYLSRADDNDKINNKSLAKLMFTEILQNVLRLDLLSSFKLEDIEEIFKAGDEIAEAWRNDGTSGDQNWADRIADQAGVSARTVRSRRTEWLDRYNVDIEIPWAFYRDLIVFGSTSWTGSEGREVLAASMTGGSKEIAQEVLTKASHDFQEQRLSMASTLERPLVKVPIEEVTSKVAVIANSLSSGNRATNSVKRRERLPKSSAAKPANDPALPSKAKDGKHLRLPSKTAGRAKSRSVVRTRGGKIVTPDNRGVVAPKRRSDKA